MPRGQRRRIARPITPPVLNPCAAGTDIGVTEFYCVLGLILMRIPGLNTGTVYTLFTELGPDLAKFRARNHFACWLGLCADNRISDGEALSVQTRQRTSGPGESRREAQARSAHCKEKGRVGVCGARGRLASDGS